MHMCFNRNVLIGLAAVAGGVLIVAPQAFLAALPVLLLLACPLSMVLMMRGMNANQSSGAGPSDASAPEARADDHAAAEEVARLRAEVDQLRAGLRDRQQDRLTGDAADL